MRKIVLILAVLAVCLLFVFGCTSTKEDSASAATNPFVECATMQQAYNLAGFTMFAPEKIDVAYQSRVIRAINGSVIEVIYPNVLDGGDEIRLRKGFAIDDVSGDYRTYAQNKTILGRGKTVLLRGDGKRFFVATWKNGKYAYAVIAKKGLTEMQILQLAAILE